MLYLYMKNGILTAATYVQKGGVGKTTTAAHVAVAAAQNHDLNTLLIDLAGTQNDLATHFGISIDEESIDAPISAVFGDQWELIRNGIDNVVERMTFDTGEGPVLIPADPGLGAADNNLANVPREERYDRLADFIAEDLAATYDFVLVDLPGKEDNIAISGLYAVEDVIAPLRPGAFERNQLENLEADLQEIRDAYPVDPRLAMVLPTMIDRRTRSPRSSLRTSARPTPISQACRSSRRRTSAITRRRGRRCSLSTTTNSTLPGKKPSTRTVRRLTSCSRLFDND